MANLNNKTITFNGLGTCSFNVLDTGATNVKGKIALPNIIEGAPANSSIVVTCNLNGGATFYTGVAGAEGFATGCYATAGDIINVILTSAAAQDNQPLGVKSTISFY